MHSYIVNTNINDIEIQDIINISYGKKKIIIDDKLLVFLKQGREKLDANLKENKTIYGINTGFGGNADLIIPFESLDHHQSNLLDFLSAGTGDCFSDDYVRASQFIIIIALSKGWSAVRPEVIILLADHINKGIIPQIPQYGSVGASGDLVPLSYIANALCGKGTVKYNNELMDASKALQLANIDPLVLKSKEGLALVNGTRVMSAVSCITLYNFENIYNAALGAVALVVEALLASREHYDMRIHLLKNHPGQIHVADTLNNYLKKNSDIKNITSNKTYTPSADITKLEQPVQEVYSLRCAPQILGVISESIESAKVVIKREILSVNDNPLIDPYTGDALSGGNFMGNHLARTMDGIKIDMALVANHLHSLTALMMYNGFSKGLPNSLSPYPGLYQGFKGMQISQTSLVVWLRQECSPASIHSLTTEQFNQDIVSLGLHSALGAANMEKKLCDVISMTLLMACQAIDLRKLQNNNFELSDKTLKLYESIRSIVPSLQEDRRTDIDIKKISNAIYQNKLNFIK
ncbi:hypothetical protein DICPUDRAFT_42810 [Dictyostelium purpureum]|uniref:Histidine ammonia-lyase n=1 Tax=Dictyostelium purpureum TaxID=5786 RepID=F1A2T8_DICPU|nr:uncharacterized protein DICPUDRAFT_42810 [Dictyostelium purpureum]EGC29492.1 hypothetical protein DICPUDRAFT_42810 [Dictyostelium purpureum]|eukprot:XP_003293982.1 hypothetical protein DICPUDRAFT_42810 [Dictyostelium purpureum]